MLTGIEIVLNITPTMWINYFSHVIVHPGHRVEFKEWTEKVSGFLKEGSNFKKLSSLPSPLEKYALLPKLWWR